MAGNNPLAALLKKKFARSCNQLPVRARIGTSAPAMAKDAKTQRVEMYAPCQRKEHINNRREHEDYLQKKRKQGHKARHERLDDKHHHQEEWQERKEDPRNAQHDHDRVDRMDNRKDRYKENHKGTSHGESHDHAEQ